MRQKVYFRTVPKNGIIWQKIYKIIPNIIDNKISLWYNFTYKVENKNDRPKV